MSAQRAAQLTWSRRLNLVGSRPFFPAASRAGCCWRAACSQPSLFADGSGGFDACRSSQLCLPACVAVCRHWMRPRACSTCTAAASSTATLRAPTCWWTAPGGSRCGMWSCMEAVAAGALTVVVSSRTHSLVPTASHNAFKLPLACNPQLTPLPTAPACLAVPALPPGLRLQPVQDYGPGAQRQRQDGHNGGGQPKVAGEAGGPWLLPRPFWACLGAVLVGSGTPLQRAKASWVLADTSCVCRPGSCPVPGARGAGGQAHLPCQRRLQLRGGALGAE